MAHLEDRGCGYAAPCGQKRKLHIQTYSNAQISNLNHTKTPVECGKGSKTQLSFLKASEVDININ